MLADRYELKALLGRGGMAEVFEAVAHGAHGFTRRVAIKRLLPGASDDATFVRLFFDEARIASKLHHANIVAVLDFASADGAPFQVLELVDGWDVEALVTRGEPIPIEVALFVAIEVAHGLAHAHDAVDDSGVSLGIVHRDVKPSNVLVSRAGEVKLGDFGIARARERIAATTANVTRGTPAFMAPEQMIGTEPAGPAADVFALGCTLHAIVTGRSPFEDQPAQMKFLAGGDAKLADTLPDDVRAVVERSLRRAPADRWPSARAMASAMGEALSRRLKSDPRSFVVDWLGRVSPSRVTEAAPREELVAHGDRVFSTKVAAARPTKKIARPRRRPWVIFAIAVAVPIALGAVAFGGILLGRRPPALPPPIASVVTVAPPPPVIVSAPEVAEPIPDAATPIARPVATDCTCVTAGRTLCAPSRARTARCKCNVSDSDPNKCWTATGHEKECSLWRDDPEGRDGQICSAAAVYRTVSDAGPNMIWQGAAAGNLTQCTRCTDPKGFPHHPGGECEGIRNEDGARARGVIVCEGSPR